MKALTHTFSWRSDAQIVDGEVVGGDEVRETHCFLMTHASHGIFERLFGQPMIPFLLSNLDVDEIESMNTMSKSDQVGLIASLLVTDYIKCLAAASWIDKGSTAGLQTLEGAMRFQDMPFYDTISNDLEFASEILSATLDANFPNQSVKKSSAPKEKSGH